MLADSRVHSQYVATLYCCTAVQYVAKQYVAMPAQGLSK